MKKNKVLAYITDKKYYLTLLCGLVVILIAVGVIYNNDQKYEEIANLNDSIQKEGLVENNQEAAVEDEQDLTETKISIHDEEVTDDQAQNEAIKQEADSTVSTAEAVTAEAEIANMPEKVVPVIKLQQPNLSFNAEEGMIMPLQGEVLIPFSEAVPVYFATLDQFQINKGIYIKAAIGSEVKAVADGVVEKIEILADRGNVITIYHGNNVMSRYGQLQKDMNVKEGDIVQRGSIIGYVEKPTNYYTLEGSHLYFEVLENDERIDPSGYVNQ